MSASSACAANDGASSNSTSNACNNLVFIVLMFLVRLYIIQCKKSITLLIIAANIHIIIHSALRNQSFLTNSHILLTNKLSFRGCTCLKCTNRATSAPTKQQVHQPSNKCTNRATIVFKSLFMRKICHISQQACNALSGSGLTAGR